MEDGRLARISKSDSVLVSAGRLSRFAGRGPTLWPHGMDGMEIAMGSFYLCHSGGWSFDTLVVLWVAICMGRRGM